MLFKEGNQWHYSQIINMLMIDCVKFHLFHEVSKVWGFKNCKSILIQQNFNCLYKLIQIRDVGENICAYYCISFSVFFYYIFCSLNVKESIKRGNTTSNRNFIYI